MECTEMHPQVLVPPNIMMATSYSFQRQKELPVEQAGHVRRLIHSSTSVAFASFSL
jgi:hypothetical protein